MTDIISRAQELVELRARMDKSILREALDVTYEESRIAPALIEALAEDQWEYGVQFRTGNEDWGDFALPFEKRYNREFCERFIKAWDNDPRFEYRLVRRRVSPVEVIE